MNNFLTAIAVLMVVILTALFAVPLMVDWDDYRGEFETRLSEILGTRVELDGSLNVRLLPTPYVRAENLRLGESGVEGRPILEVDEMTLWVGIPPLLKGIIEASTLTLERPRLLLQFDKNGQPTFDAKQAAVTRADDAAGENADAPPGDGVIISGFKLSPQLISLKNVRVNNGEAIVQSVVNGEGAPRRLVLSGVAGVLSAVTLNGPIYFNGRYGSEEDPSFIRLAIGQEQRADHYPVRAKLTVPQMDHRYEYDGVLIDNKGRWSSKGALKATLGRFGNLGRRGVISADEIAPIVNEQKDPLPLDEEEEAALKKKKEKALARKASLTNAEQEIILTSNLDIAGTEAQLDEILLRGGSLAQPQTVRGSMKINWQSALTLTGKADGQVIDLNVIYGLQPNGKIDRITPSAALSNLNDLLLDQANRFDTIDFAATAQQINVGEGVVRDFRLLLKSQGERIEVKEFTARMPGSSRLTVSGDFSREEAQPGFAGDVYLRGLQFPEFLRWAAPTLKLELGNEEEQSIGRGKFILSGQLAVDEGALALTGAQGEIAGTALRGDFQHLKARLNESEPVAGQTTLTLRAGVLNVSDVLGRPVEVLNYEQGLKDFLNVAGLVPGPDAAVEAGAAAPLVTSDNVVIFNFAAQKLVFDDGEQRDVRLTWRADKEGGRIVTLAGLSENGLRIIFDKGGVGSVVTPAEGDKSEMRRFIVEADESAGVRDLLKWSGVFEKVEFDDRTLRRFLPLRLAVHREDGEGVRNYRVDGVLGGNDAGFTVSVPTREEGENSLPITLLGGVESGNGADLALQLMPFGREELVLPSSIDAADERGSLADFGPARLTFSASGTVAEGFTGQFALENEKLRMNYNGGLTIRGNKMTSRGTVELLSENTEHVVQLFGLPPLADDEVRPFRGEVVLQQNPKGFSLKDLKVAVGDLQIRGAGSFDLSDEERVYRLALATEAVDVRTLLAPLQQNTGLSRRGGGSADEVWSDVPFKPVEAVGQGDGDGEEVGTKSGIRGEVSLQTNELLISDQMSLSDARLQWRFSDDVIEIIKVEGKGLGGAFAASGTLRQDGDGYSLNGVAELVNGQLEQIGAAEEASLGNGRFGVNLSMSGRGKSVRSLVGNLVGEGAIKIQDGALRQLSPKLVAGVARAFLSEEDGDVKELKAQLSQAVETSDDLKIGDVDLGIEMLDGTIRLNQPDLGVGPGTVGIEARLRLEDLSWQGVWTIQPAQAPVLAVPAVRRELNGRLTTQSGFKAKLDATEFERFLVLKKKEEELRRLEKIRLEEEQRRLAEEKRRKEEELRRLELERKRLQEEQRRLDEELDRSALPPL